MKNSKYLSSIVVKINLLSLIAGAMMALLISRIMFTSARDKIDENISNSTLHNLALSSAEISTHLSDLSNFSYYLSSDLSVNHFLTTSPGSADYRSRAILAYDNIKSQLSTMPESSKYILKLLVSRPDGKSLVLGSSGGTFSDVRRYYNLPDSLDLFARNSNNLSPFLDTTFMASNSIAYETVTVLPFGSYIYRTGSSHSIGWYFIAVHSKLFADILNTACDTSTPIIFRIGESNYLLSGNSFTLIDSFACDNIPGDTAVPNRFRGSYDGSDVEVIGVFAPDSGFSIYQVLPKNSFSLLSFGSLEVIMTILAVFGLTSLLLIIILQGIIVKPVKRILLLIGRISGGDFSPDPSVEGNDELGTIGHGINQMSESIQSLISARITNEKQKRQLELMSLQYQINPHFLYNTLGCIKWMAMMQGINGITQMTDDLIYLYKSISRNKSSYVSLGDELLFLEKYVSLLQYRYGDSFQYSVTIDDPAVRDVQILKFTIQPIVENAIFHGLEGKKGAGVIHITAEKNGEDCVITVTDNGVGMSQDQIDELMNNKKETKLFSQSGLQNTNQRIKLEYGDRYGVSIESHINEYTRATLLLPFITASGEEVYV